MKALDILKELKKSYMQNIDEENKTREAIAELEAQEAKSCKWKECNDEHDTLKDGDRIYVNGDEYIFHGITMLGDEEYMRCTKVKSNVPMLVEVKDNA